MVLGARAGDVVAIFGMGGLGHLGIQFASKMALRYFSCHWAIRERQGRGIGQDYGCKAIH